MDNKQIEKLLAENSETTPAPVVKAALEEVQKRQKEAAVRETIARLESANQNTLSAVNYLREARKKEKLAKTYLTSISDAENAFISNGNWDEYTKALTEANRAYSAARY